MKKINIPYSEFMKLVEGRRWLWMETKIEVGTFLQIFAVSNGVEYSNGHLFKVIDVTEKGTGCIWDLEEWCAKTK